MLTSLLNANIITPLVVERIKSTLNTFTRITLCACTLQSGCSSILSMHEIDAMVFWNTAVFYYYKECLSPIGQMINYQWVKRAKAMLTAAESLNAKWRGDIIYLSWRIYYLSVPEDVGEDRALSAEYFDRPIKTGSDWMVNRWAKAKYFHV